MIKFKVHLPKQANTQAVYDVLRKEAKVIGESMVKDFDKVTNGWTGARPVWKFRYGANQYQVYVTVYMPDTDSEGAKKWIWLNDGVKPHSISPKALGGVLAFQPGYNPGSKPGSLFTSNKTRSGDPIVRKKVNHPGNAPRNWENKLNDDLKPLWDSWMKAAISHAIRASGHSI